MTLKELLDAYNFDCNCNQVRIKPGCFSDSYIDISFSSNRTKTEIYTRFIKDSMLDMEVLAFDYDSDLNVLVVTLDKTAANLDSTVETPASKVFIDDNFDIVVKK